MRVTTKTARGFFAVALELNHSLERTGELRPFRYRLSLGRLNFNVGCCQAHQKLDHRAFVFDVLLFLALFHFEERRLHDVNVTALNQLWHLTEEEGQQQSANM